MTPPQRSTTTSATQTTRSSAHLLCFSHLRWNFVFQRPQHLMQRFARQMPVHFWEEPEFVAGQPEEGRLEISTDATGVTRVVPQLRLDMGHDKDARVLRELGATEVHTTRSTAAGHLGDVPPEKVVAALVHAGVAVTGFRVARPTLEDVFVALTGEGFDVSG